MSAADVRRGAPCALLFAGLFGVCICGGVTSAIVSYITGSGAREMRMRAASRTKAANDKASAGTWAQIHERRRELELVYEERDRAWARMDEVRRRTGYLPDTKLKPRRMSDSNILVVAGGAGDDENSSTTIPDLDPIEYGRYGEPDLALLEDTSLTDRDLVARELHHYAGGIPFIVKMTVEPHGESARTFRLQFDLRPPKVPWFSVVLVGALRMLEKSLPRNVIREVLVVRTADSTKTSLKTKSLAEAVRTLPGW